MSLLLIRLSILLTEKGMAMLPDIARYESPPNHYQKLGLICTGYGFQQRKTQSCVQRRLKCFAALWISHGSGWFESEVTAQRITISAGSLLWLFPGITHSYAPDLRTWTEQWALFEGSLAEDFMQRNLLSPLQSVQQRVDEATVAPLFLQIRTDFLSNSPIATILAGTVIQRMILLNSPHMLPREWDREGKMQAICEWLEMHAPEVIDFSELAIRYGKGYSTFRRQFKEFTGLSPKAYVQRIRLQAAKERLVLTQQPITEIAQAVGFADPIQFSHFFQAKEGVSPTMFREQHKGGA